MNRIRVVKINCSCIEIQVTYKLKMLEKNKKVFLVQSQRIASIWVIGFIMMHLDMIGEFLSNKRGRWEAFSFQPTAGIGKDRTKPFANRRGVTLEIKKKQD